nr:hypothetical protein [Tanacetum cinerariifolium]
TPANDNNPFVAPPSNDTVIEYVNTLGYPNQDILCYRFCGGIIHSSNINYAKRIWEEFVQSIQTFLTDKKNLATASRRKKKTTHLLIPSIRYVGNDGREIFDMSLPDALLTGGVTESSKATKVTKPKAAKATKPTSGPKPKPVPTQPPKAAPEKKRKLVQETPDEPSPAKILKDVPVKEPAYNKEEANLQRALDLSLNEQAEGTQGSAHPMVIKEPDSERFQPLPEVQGKGKEKGGIGSTSIAYIPGARTFGFTGSGIVMHFIFPFI